MTTDTIDPSAFGSDVARSRKQYWARKFADAMIGVLGLNSGGFLATEIVQKIAPVLEIEIPSGKLRCRGGHGRLRWRMETFWTEEPETVQWLDTFTGDDVFWDVGANVGLYSIYAALQTGCRTISFEPEAQNFALFIENIVLNNVQDQVTATNTPLTRELGFGTLHVHSLTKSGAYNHFRTEGHTIRGYGGSDGPVTQLQMGVSIDELVTNHKFPFPTRLKIDVDGNEPDIIAGAARTLSDARLQGVMIELVPNHPDHIAIYRQLEQAGFAILTRATNYDRDEVKHRKDTIPQENLVWHRPNA